MRLLLVVEDVFRIAGRGLALAPDLSAELGEELGAGSLGVELVLPGGERLMRTARVHLEHFNPTGFRYVCLLDPFKDETVPVGTEVWHAGG